MRSGVSFPSFKTIGEKPKGPLEKFLSLFADVRAGEGLGALILMVNVFLLLAAYYLLKTAREPMVLTEGGATVKAYSSAGQAALLMILVPLYGLVGTRVKRIVLVMGLTLFFASHLLVFQAVGATGSQIGVAFYIWVGIFNVFVISQFWAFANDLYTESQGKRLFPMIGVGASVGAFAGAQIATVLFKQLKLTPYALMGLAAGALVVCATLTWVANRTEVRREDQVMAQHADEPLGKEGGFSLIFHDRYLLLIACLIVLLNLVNTTGEFLLSTLVENAAVQQFAGNKAAMQAFIGGFYGDYFRWVNLLGIVFQTLLVSRVFRLIGVRGALFVLPSIALVSYSILAVAPLLTLVRLVKTLENSTDYSLQNTVRQALFLPTSREAKYKAKAAIDSFFHRFGDVLQSGVVKVGNELSIGFTGFAWLNVGLTVVWLWIASRLYREHRRMGF
jgi:AAA family ATP:ADP antiporter